MSPPRQRCLVSQCTRRDDIRRPRARFKRFVSTRSRKFSLDLFSCARDSYTNKSSSPPGGALHRAVPPVPVYTITAGRVYGARRTVIFHALARGRPGLSGSGRPTRDGFPTSDRRTDVFFFFFFFGLRVKRGIYRHLVVLTMAFFLFFFSVNTFAGS